MAKKRMFGQRTWHFSDAGNKFDGPPKQSRRSSLKPISPALKRGVIHCTRCGSRVVSNVGNCPFCGRSLRPVYARFWFWLIIVVVVAIGAIVFINLNLPKESTAPSNPAEPALPQVVNGEEGGSLKDLTLGTTIDSSGLEVTVETITRGQLASNGSQVYEIEITYSNTTEEAVILYSTQWQLQLSNAARLDTFVGSSADGQTISSSYDVYTLEAGEKYGATLYYAVEQPVATEEELAAGVEPAALAPVALVYYPSALSYSEDLLVTWKVSEDAIKIRETDTGGSGS